MCVYIYDVYDVYVYICTYLYIDYLYKVSTINITKKVNHYLHSKWIILSSISPVSQCITLHTLVHYKADYF